jgi:hypothetical protein
MAGGKNQESPMVTSMLGKVLVAARLDHGGEQMIDVI